MLTKQQLQDKSSEIKAQIEQSMAKITETRSQLEQMTANHNALLGAQLLSNQLLEECPEDAKAKEPEVIDGASC